MAKNTDAKGRLNFLADKETVDRFVEICEDECETPSLVLRLFCKKVVRIGKIPYKFLLEE